MTARGSSPQDAGGVGWGDEEGTRDGSQPSAGGATRALTLPHLPYADAVLAELTLSGLEPDRVDAGVRREPGGPRELYVTTVWSPGHPDLDRAAWPDGLTLSWSHLTGWSTHDGDTVRALADVDALAPPTLIADAVLHLAVHGQGIPWLPPAGGRWEYAADLDAAIDAFTERGADW
ncbi:hypothetical protein OIA45_39625 [Streptomyces chartreusis]|uniref:hypothetical protein n=1 Tax=Streptomyces chartreusis TaxID=1969 RepID=UPI00387037AB|nr:hypothetical protein OIA45_39625 [Streptomyces chartreusis]